MRSRSIASAASLLAVLALLLSIQMYVAHTRASGADFAQHVPLKARRKLPSDLEVGGDLAGLSGGTTRYVTLDSLLNLSLVTYTVTDDPNFSGLTKIGGILPEDLPRLAGAKFSRGFIGRL